MGFFKKIIFHILATAGVFWAIETYALPDVFIVEGGAPSYLFAAFVFGLLNSTVKPILKLLTFPIKILTLGISSIFLNAGLLWSWEKLINFLGIETMQIEIANFQTYILAGILLAMANFLLHWFEGK